MDLNPSGATQQPHPYIICLEVTQVSDDANPDKERRCSKQNAAQIVICEVLGNEKTGMSKIFYSTQLMNLTLKLTRMDHLPLYSDPESFYTEEGNNREHKFQMCSSLPFSIKIG